MPDHQDWSQIMAIIGIGVDVAQIDRYADMETKYGGRFIRRILHPLEIQLLDRRLDRKRAEFIAGRFACKEAAKKALGDFPDRGVAWTDIYVLDRSNGKPDLFFEGPAAQLAKELGVIAGHVSISHDGGMAVAQVILESH